MKIHLNTGITNSISMCDGQTVTINATQYDSSVILTPQAVVPWPAGDTDLLTVTVLEQVADYVHTGTVVLLGSNDAASCRANNSGWDMAQWQRPFAAKQTVLEVMSLRAACRTYNILLGDGRDVVAALMLAHKR